MFYFSKHTAVINSIINIHGTPNVNFKCFVLCLKTYIPAKIPIEPPQNEKKTGRRHSPMIHSTRS